MVSKVNFLFLQRRDATAVRANTEVGVALSALRSMRKADGVNTKCMREEFEKSSTFKGVSVSQPGDGGRRKAEVFRERFFVSLADNIERRLDCQRDHLCRRRSKSIKLAI
ncbi:unnamed protein product [Arctogadus glacialis]